MGGDFKSWIAEEIDDEGAKSGSEGNSDMDVVEVDEVAGEGVGGVVRSRV